MPKVFMVTSGLTGILNASYELVRRLEAEGYEVLYGSPRQVEEKVVAQGISYVQLPHVPSETEIDRPPTDGDKSKWKRIYERYKYRKELRAMALESIHPTEYLRVLQEYNPDLVLIDVELHEYIISTHVSTYDLVILSQWFSLWQRFGLPYLLHDTIPGRGIRGNSIAIRASWAIISIMRQWAFLKKKIRSASTDRRSVLLRYAKSVDFPLDWIKENNWPGPFTYDQLPVVMMVAEELEFPHEYRRHSYYLGPMVAEERAEVDVVKADYMDEIEDLIDVLKKAGKRLIYCSVSTLHPGDQAFVNRLIEAVSTRDDLELIIGMGGLIEQEDVEVLPSNVHAYSYVPQLVVLRSADLSINHGGIHTINECIHFKVPMLIYSGKRSDQNGCAARVHFHGVGIMSDKDADTVSQIRANIDLVLDDPVYRNKINNLHECCTRYAVRGYLKSTLASALSHRYN